MNTTHTCMHGMHGFRVDFDEIHRDGNLVNIFAFHDFFPRRITKLTYVRPKKVRYGTSYMCDLWPCPGHGNHIGWCDHRLQFYGGAELVERHGWVNGGGRVGMRGEGRGVQ